jgi:sulfotransferase family protein
MELVHDSELPNGSSLGRPRVVSIIGSGRSGSTVLDVVLGSHPNIEGVGALSKLPHSGWVQDDNRRCSCGSPIHACPYWGGVHRRWIDIVGADGLTRYIDLQARYERSSKGWPRLLLEERIPSAAFLEYAHMTAALYGSIRDVSGKPVVLDSSKKPMRTYALLATGAVDVRVLHLVRDGRGVVWSRLKALPRDVEAGVPSAQPPTPPWRTTLHWTQANIESEWVTRRAGRSNASRIAYESLVETPGELLERISPIVGEDLSELMGGLENGQTMHAGHRVGGNRMRLSGSVRLRPDLEWMAKLSSSDAQTFWRMAGWLARRYGYVR